MTLALCFWIVFLIWTILSVRTKPQDWRSSGEWLLFWALLGILGWAVFGPMLR